jgi:hypothetical protein
MQSALTTDPNSTNGSWWMHSDPAYEQPQNTEVIVKGNKSGEPETSTNCRWWDSLE